MQLRNRGGYVGKVAKVDHKREGQEEKDKQGWGRGTAHK